MSPIIADIVKAILRSLNFQIMEKGCGLDMVFIIKRDGKHAEFYLRNLFLEIATVDRDQEPLRFDENLRDFDQFLAKTAGIVESKLNILFHLFGEEDMDAAIESIIKDAKRYERIRIWRFDKNDSEQKVR